MSIRAWEFLAFGSDSRSLSPHSKLSLPAGAPERLQRPLPLPAFSPSQSAVPYTTSKYAAIALAAGKLSNGLSRVTGVASREPSPLFGQDKPWEPRLDNGYPNIVAPAAEGGAWQLWYGDCVKGCATQLLLYANSTDGVAWHKPELGLFHLGTVRPDLQAIGTRNNIVLEGGGIGVYHDPAEPDAARRYKAFGPGCYTRDEGCHLEWDTHGGGLWGGWPTSDDLAYSADGLHWTGLGKVKWPSPQRYDCHNTLVRDHRGSFVATTRDGFSAAPGRTIGIALSQAGAEALAFNTSRAPKLTLAGSLAHQLYSQITFPWLDVWLGINMVYDAQDPHGRVHCRLAWATSPQGEWQWADEVGGLTGADLIPLGPDGGFDSHVRLAATTTNLNPHAAPNLSPDPGPN